eukprot:gene7921-52082_t
MQDAELKELLSLMGYSEAQCLLLSLRMRKYNAGETGDGEPPPYDEEPPAEEHPTQEEAHPAEAQEDGHPAEGQPGEAQAYQQEQQHQWGQREEAAAAVPPPLPGAAAAPRHPPPRRDDRPAGWKRAGPATAGGDAKRPRDHQHGRRDEGIPPAAADGEPGGADAARLRVEIQQLRSQLGRDTP